MKPHNLTFKIEGVRSELKFTFMLSCDGCGCYMEAFARINEIKQRKILVERIQQKLTEEFMRNNMTDCDENKKYQVIREIHDE